MSHRETHYNRIEQSTRTVIEAWCDLRHIELDVDLKGLFAMAYLDGRLSMLDETQKEIDQKMIDDLARGLQA